MRLKPFTAGLSLAFLMLAACSGGGDPDKVPGDTDEDTDTDIDTDTDVDTDTDTSEITWYRGSTYRVSELRLFAETDTDGDGVKDNHMPLALLVVDLVIATESFTVTSFNANLQDNIDDFETIILLDVRSDGRAVSLDMLRGQGTSLNNLQPAPDSYDADGAALSTLNGFFTSESAFYAGPADIEVPITLVQGLPPAPLGVLDVQMSGDANLTTVTGKLAGVIPIRQVIDKLIAPLIPPQGIDITGDGVPETQAEVIALIENVAPQLGDVDLGGGERGISSVFSFRAIQHNW